MADSQSRYGIMDELNTKKIQAKEKLAKIESATDDYVYKIEQKIDDIKHNVINKEQTYEKEFKVWKREQEVNLRLMEQDFERQTTNIKNRIAEKEANYVGDFKSWKENQLEQAKNFTTELNRYKTQQDKAIEDQKAIIEEYEKSINDLKEMSKEKTE